MDDPIYIILAIIGFLFLAILALKLLRAIFCLIYPFFIARPKDLRKLAGAKWAVVTGASDGIGKQYAIELAKKGFNLMLISRSADKLKNVKEEILRKNVLQIEVKWIAFDFTNGDITAYEKRIFPELEKLSIGILVNNVGVAHDISRFHDIQGGPRKIATDLVYRKIFVVNTVPHTVLSAFVLKQMVARKNGIIINIASILGSYPIYHISLYSAVKKYLQWFSEILRKDYAGTGIIIQTVSPGIVVTKMSKGMAGPEKPGFFAPSVEKFVGQALRTIGNSDDTNGYFGHQLQKFFMDLTPNWLRNIAMKYQMKQLEAKQKSMLH